MARATKSIRIMILWIMVVAAIGLCLKLLPDSPFYSFTTTPNGESMPTGKALFGNLFYWLLIGVVEEMLLCWVAVPLVVWLIDRILQEPQNTNKKRLLVAIICAAIFGVAHVITGLGLGLEILGIILKTIQTALFGFCMVWLYMSTENIVWPIFTHVAFDTIYLGMPLIMQNMVPYEGIGMIVPTDTLLSLVVVGVLLIPAVAYIIVSGFSRGFSRDLPQELPASTLHNG